LLKFSSVGSNRGSLIDYYNNISSFSDFIEVFKVLLYLSHKSRESIKYFIGLQLMFLWHSLHLVLKIEFKLLSCYALKINYCEHNLSVFIQKIWHVKEEVEF